MATRMCLLHMIGRKAYPFLFIIPYISFVGLVDLNSGLSRALIIYTSFILYAHKATGTHI